jgi:hypothetical protein
MQSPRVEPTVLGCFAIQATSPQAVCPEALELMDASADWLAGLQQANGAVLSDERGGPADCRSTAWAALLWSQLPNRRGCLARAIRFLLEQEACAQPSCDDEILDRGATVGGWPWFDAAGGWTTATAVTLLVLGQNQLAGHARVADSLAWIASHAVDDGGWSDPTSDAAEASPAADAGVTGMMLLALRAAGATDTLAIHQAGDFLAHTLPDVTSPEPLSWGLLGWSSWHPLPLGVSEWLAQSFASTPGVLESPEQLALLLLATAPAAFRAVLALAEVSEPVEQWHPLVST